jgi:hypothetical protein
MKRHPMRDSFVGYSDADGYGSDGFRITPETYIRRQAGYFVLIPVQNQQAGEDLIRRIHASPDNSSEAL